MGGREHTPNDIYIQDETAWMVLTNREHFPIAVTILDAADVPLVQSWGLRWCASWHPKCQNYRVLAKDPAGGKERTVYLHRKLLCPLPGMETDHINHNTLDNRRKNLRAATRQENALNYRPGAYESLRRHKPPTTGLPKPPKCAKGRRQSWVLPPPDTGGEGEEEHCRAVGTPGPPRV
jgi:hypothetical protein